MSNPPANKMTSGERRDLLHLVTKTEKRNLARVKAAEAEAKRRIEEQLTARWEITDFPEIAEIVARNREVEKQAQAELAAACDRAGIPQKFRPRISSQWDGGGWRPYGYETGLFSIQQVRASLYKHVDAAVALAKSQVEGEAVAARTKLLTGAFSGEDAASALARIEQFAELPPPPSLRDAVRTIHGFDLPSKVREQRQIAGPTADEGDAP